jgi:hypothetical protein
MTRLFGLKSKEPHSDTVPADTAATERVANILRAAAIKQPLERIKMHMKHALADCEGPECEKLHYKLDAARSANDLWQLRSDLHQLISRLHSQQEAARRINHLLPCFAHWLPPHQLIRI